MKPEGAIELHPHYDLTDLGFVEAYALISFHARKPAQDINLVINSRGVLHAGRIIGVISNTGINCTLTINDLLNNGEWIIEGNKNKIWSPGGWRLGD